MDSTKELAKFGTIGVVNLVVNFAVWNLLMPDAASRQ